MDAIPISKVRRKLGEHLKRAQRDEIPFTVRLRFDPVCVGAPRDWFKRACRGLDPQPEVTRGLEGHDKQRLEFHLMVGQAAEGGFISIPRMEGIACVLVPIPWYEEQVRRIGPPAGYKQAEGEDPPDKTQSGA